MILHFIECLLVCVLLFVIWLIHDELKNQKLIQEYVKKLKQRRPQNGNIFRRLGLRK